MSFHNLNRGDILRGCSFIDHEMHYMKIMDIRASEILVLYIIWDFIFVMSLNEHTFDSDATYSKATKFEVIKLSNRLKSYIPNKYDMLVMKDWYKNTI